MSAKRKSEHLWCTYSNVFSITRLVLLKKGKPLFDCLFYNCWCQNTLSWSGELLFLGIANFESMTQGSFNLHISQWQTVVLHALHVRMLFNFCTFHGRFRPFDDRRTWRQFVFLYSSLIPGYIEHILQAWLVVNYFRNTKLHFQMHDVLCLY